jgi:alcohol dehydrogenase (cytochrome c)
MTQLDGSGEASKYSGEADMTVYKGVGYYPTGADDIFAISVKSGKILWTHKGELPETVADVCCGWDNRGVAIGDGLVYSAVLTGSVEALNQKTGELVWKTELGEPAEGFTATSQPLYYEGMVFIGPVGSEYGVRGFMEAFNAKTGALVWKHYNIPAPGEYGHETWPTAAEGPTRAGTCKECDNEWQHGGSTTWNAPTVSAKTGDIYYSTANAGGGGVNGGDYGGATRGGANLWTASMLALNYKTGEMAWGYQEVHHDIWDYDQSVAPIMINAEVEGKKQEDVAVGNKDGYIYDVNAETGQPVFPAPEKAMPQDIPLEATYPTEPVPAIPPAEAMHPTAAEMTAFQESACTEAAKTTQYHKPFPCPKVVEGGYEGLNVFAAYNEVGSPTVDLSSAGGSGIRTNNDAYDPETGLFITCSRGGQWGGKQFVSQNQLPQGEAFGTGKTGLSVSLNGTQVGNERHGWLAATNLNTGKQAWMVETEEPCYSGVAYTKGGVLFLGEEEGRLAAYDASTGKKLWSTEIGAPPGMVSVYEMEGKEHVSIYAGGNSLEGGGKAHADDLWQFSLSGSGAQGPIALGQTPPPPTTLGPGGE